MAKKSGPRAFTFGPANRIEGTYVIRARMLVITTPFGSFEEVASSNVVTNDFVARDAANKHRREHLALMK